MDEKDYLIVGQGIAGTLLAHFLLKRNKNILIVDEYDPASSSNVAAGLFNPITGRRHVMSWKAETLFPFAETIYNELEQFLQTRIYYPLNLYTFFSTDEEKNAWMAKSDTSELSQYIAETQQPFSNKCIQTQNYGGLAISKTGYLNMALLVSSFKEKMELDGKRLENQFVCSDLVLEGNYAIWKNTKFKKVIFCEGHKASLNPYFSWLPFVLAKGEVLSFYSKQLQLNTIINKGIFILPLGNNVYKTGSTYEWNFTTSAPSAQGLEILRIKLNRIINCPYEILSHQAGIRPTVKDRRPLIGLHPAHPCLGVFNGLGTKGTSLAPYFANHFVNFLEDGMPLLNEVDIVRFYNQY